MSRSAVRGGKREPRDARSPSPDRCRDVVSVAAGEDASKCNFGGKIRLSLLTLANRKGALYRQYNFLMLAVSALIGAGAAPPGLTAEMVAALMLLIKEGLEGNQFADEVKFLASDFARGNRLLREYFYRAMMFAARAGAVWPSTTTNVVERMCQVTIPGDIQYHTQHGLFAKATAAPVVPVAINDAF